MIVISLFSTGNHNFQFVLSFFLQLMVLHKTDYSQGFGGKFGVQKDRQDKSAAGWDHIEKVDKHVSQKGMILMSTYFCHTGKKNSSEFYVF